MKPPPAARTDFSVGLFEALVREKSGKNLFLSPFSIGAALAMCAAGARGETRTVLARLLGLPSDIEEQNREFARRLRSFQAGCGDRVQLTVANALWAQTGFHPRPEYLRILADFYDSGLHQVDFDKLPDQAVGAIESWIVAATQGKIRNLVTRQQISADTRLILTNAVHFKGPWERGFDPDQTLEEDWHGPGGIRQVPMMQQRGPVPYFENAAFQAVELPYRQSELAMLVVLPQKTNGLPALERDLVGIFKALEPSALLPGGEVIVSLPRFRIEAEFELKSLLRGMGAELPFSPRADYSGIAEEPLLPGEVLHKALIEVDEEGTTAAAATAVLMVKSAALPPRIFRADHPFLFVIRERTTRTILFCGRVVEPGGS